MGLLIKNTCVNCGICEPECPNDAIIFGPEFYEILPDRCTECIGYYDLPQCERVCPINKCIISDPDNQENEEALWRKFAILEQES